MGDAPTERAAVLQSKRQATQYQILVQIAQHQPAISQREIADAIGITPQAVSSHLGDLVEEGFVEAEGRGRYTTTKEGVDWLITRTDRLEAYVDHVAGDVIEQIEVESAIATASIEEGDRVSMTMRGGYLHADPVESETATEGATAVAVTDAAASEDVGITDFEGLVALEPGTVTVGSVPVIRNGGSAATDPEAVADHATSADLVAVAGVEAVAAARRADVAVDIRFGTTEAVAEAATRGLDAFALVVADRLSTQTDLLRDRDVSYEVVDLTS